MSSSEIARMTHKRPPIEMNEGICLKILKIVTDIQAKVSSIASTIQEDNVEMRSIKDMEKAKEYEDLAKLNATLEDSKEFVRLVKVFSLLGGKDYQAATRCILSKLISNQLAIKLSWVGTDEKKAFKEFPRVLDLVIAAVQSNKLFPDVPNSEIKACIQRWIRGANDRCGGRNQRKKSNPAGM